MNNWLKEINFVKQIANQLLTPKKTMYYDDFLIYKLSQNSHRKHKTLRIPNEFNQLLSTTLVYQHQVKNQVCIIFLHGYGSNKQQGFSLIDYLPNSMDLCCFDFSSSGKSQGKITTYGLKQFRDIRTVIQELKKQEYGYKKFILWGRSMGAVSSFLMCSSEQQIDKELTKDIIYQVIDSPFSSFQTICFHQGRQAFKLPQAFISYGIDILKSSYKDNLEHQNPFNIDLVKVAKKCRISTLFVFSQRDDIIPQQNTLSIIQNLPTSTMYQKLLINQSHNQLRKHETNLQIFRIIEKKYLKYLYNKNKQSRILTNQLNEISKNLMKNTSFKKKISVNNINFDQRNLQVKLNQDMKNSESTSGEVSRKQPVKKEKKYLQLFSSPLHYKNKIHKFMKDKILNIQTNKQSNDRCLESHQSYRQIFRNVNNKDKSTKMPINHQLSLNEIHKMRRTKTLDFQDQQLILNCESQSKLKNVAYLISPHKTPKKINQQLLKKNKIHKRALYCSLNKNNKIELKFQSEKNKKITSIINLNQG